MSGPISVTIPLKVAIVHGDETLTELTLTEPSLGSLMELDKATGDMAQVLGTIVACTQLPPSVVRQLRARDMRTIGEAATKLLGESGSADGESPPVGLRIPSIGRLAS